MYFLEDETIGMRHLTIEDCEGNYKNWFNDNEVCQYNTHHKFPMTVEALKAYVRDLDSRNDAIVFAVIDKESTSHIGNISLQEIDFLNRSAEIAFIFGEKKYWGKGYATKAAILVVNHAFHELDMNRIYFGTLSDNLAMLRIGEKLKFKYGGVKREAIFKNGKFCDVLEYDLLRDDWEKNEMCDTDQQ